MKNLCFEDYEKAKSLLAEYVFKREDIKAIWQYGEVSNPGVSDLDLVAIVADRPSAGISDYLKKENFDPLILRAMAHANLIIVSESTTDGLLLWDDINLKNIQDGSIVRPPPDLNIRHRAIAMLADWTFERIYRLNTIYSEGIKNQQLGLGMLKSFCFCVENYIYLNNGHIPDGYDRLKDQIHELRQVWLSLEKQERVERVQSTYIDFHEFLHTFHEMVFQYFLNEVWYPEYYGKSNYSFTFPDGLIYLFEDKFVKRSDCVVLPRPLLHHFGLYASFEDPLSLKLKNSFNEYPIIVDTFPDYEYQNFLSARMHVACKWYDFLKANDFNYGSFKFGWYLN